MYFCAMNNPAHFVLEMKMTNRARFFHYLAILEIVVACQMALAWCLIRRNIKC